MGQNFVDDGESRENFGGPLYASWDEIQAKGSEELKSICALITDGVPPGNNPYTGKPYEIKWKKRRNKNAD